MSQTIILILRELCAIALLTAHNSFLLLVVSAGDNATPGAKCDSYRRLTLPPSSVSDISSLNAVLCITERAHASTADKQNHECVFMPDIKMKATSPPTPSFTEVLYFKKLLKWAWIPGNPARASTESIYSTQQKIKGLGVFFYIVCCVLVRGKTSRWARAPLESPLLSRQTKAPFTAWAWRKAFHLHVCSHRSSSNSEQRDTENPLKIKSRAGASDQSWEPDRDLKMMTWISDVKDFVAVFVT